MHVGPARLDERQSFHQAPQSNRVLPIAMATTLRTGSRVAAASRKAVTMVPVQVPRAVRLVSSRAAPAVRIPQTPSLARSTVR